VPRIDPGRPGCVRLLGEQEAPAREGEPMKGIAN
jgi:hypothetical protein